MVYSFKGLGKLSESPGFGGEFRKFPRPWLQSKPDTKMVYKTKTMVKNQKGGHPRLFMVGTTPPPPKKREEEARCGSPFDFRKHKRDILRKAARNISSIPLQG